MVEQLIWQKYIFNHTPILYSCLQFINSTRNRTCTRNKPWITKYLSGWYHVTSWFTQKKWHLDRHQIQCCCSWRDTNGSPDQASQQSTRWRNLHFSGRFYDENHRNQMKLCLLPNRNNSWIFNFFGRKSKIPNSKVEKTAKKEHGGGSTL